jgi:Ca2+-transporting ATPase
MVGKPGIRRVSASALTGNVLVFFDAELNLQDLTSILKSTIERKLGGNRRQVIRSHIKNGGNPDFPTSRSDTHLVRQSSPRLLAIPPASQTPPWHLLDAENALAFFQSSKSSGLSSSEAKKRLRKHGLNSLPAAERRSGLRIFLEQFKSLPFSLLAASAVLSLLTGGIADAVIIAGVILVNATIGAITETQAERTINSLTDGSHRQVRVIRDGRLQQVNAERIVPGDILVLIPGLQVPADARLIEVRSLHVDEAPLTGESLPVRKSATQIAGEASLADRVNMVYRGTVVTGGSGLAVAVATGTRTEIGRIQSLIGETRSPHTPMQRQIEKLGTHMVYICGATCGVVFLLGLLRGHSLLQMLKSAVSLAVAAIPEGLPTVATTTLSLGVRDMRRNGVLVRRLDAVESLGAVQIICLDKTGTLTENRMAVLSLFVGEKPVKVRDGVFHSAEGKLDPYANDELLRLLHIAVLCNETEIKGDGNAFELEGSATETALIEMALSAGVNVNSLRRQHSKIKVEYRTEGRSYMRTFLRTQSRGTLLVVKGAPNEVLSLCRTYIKDGTRSELTEETRAALLEENERMAGEALRVLGFAYTESEDDASLAANELTWVGLAGLADPVRAGIRELVELFHQAGIKTVMVTGDQSATAYAIGKELGLGKDGHIEMIDSTHLERLNPQLLSALAQRVDIFSRVSPVNKLHVVQALQNAGRVVAMTGDGINDGPALKAAEVGIAMGSNGAEVARSVADIVLERDDLQKVIVAISQGRTTYNNIRKSLHFLMSTNMSEIMLMLSSIGAGVGQPLNPMQLLWINLLTDIFPALGLSVEPPEPDVLRVRPRDPNVSIIGREELKRYTFESTVVTGGTFASYLYGVLRYGVGPQAGSIAFNTLVFAQLLHAYSCRSERSGLFRGNRLPSNQHLNAAVGGSFALQLVSFFVPGLRGLLGTVTPRPIDLLAIVGGSVLPFVINEATKNGTRSRLN